MYRTIWIPIIVFLTANVLMPCVFGVDELLRYEQGVHLSNAEYPKTFISIKADKGINFVEFGGVSADGKSVSFGVNKLDDTDYWVFSLGRSIHQNMSSPDNTVITHQSANYDGLKETITILYGQEVRRFTYLDIFSEDRRESLLFDPILLEQVNCYFFLIEQFILKSFKKEISDHFKEEIPFQRAILLISQKTRDLRNRLKNSSDSE